MKELSRFENFLEEIRIPLRLTAITPSGWPMVVSLWFQYKDGLLVCATKKSARIVSYLENNPRCAFEIAPDSPPYRGVRGQAIAQIDSSTGKEALEELLHRYVGDLDNPFAQKLLADSGNEVAIYLNPRKVFTWDYSKRMRDVTPQMLSLSSRFTNV